MNPEQEKSKSCWPWAHRWTKWISIEKGKILKAFCEGSKQDQPIASYENQRRECEICGKVQLRKEVTDISVVESQ